MAVNSILCRNKMISYLAKQINTIVKSSPLLQNMYKLVTSVKGVGSQTALFLIVYCAHIVG